jgi:hypothetical protein
MTACSDYELHERLLECDGRHGGTQVQVTMSDGCSGRVCQECYVRLGIGRWLGLSERIAGPAEGLDVLQLLRALNR